LHFKDFFMANEFSKEERVAFEDILEGFNDALVLSKNVAVYNTDQSMMERAGNVIWRPEPYIMQSFNGTDQTLNFKDATQLSVPATIGFTQSVPWVMTATELRDALQENLLGAAAKQKLASDINIAIMNVAALQGSLVVPIGAAATGFTDVAAIEAVMNEQGVPDYDRFLALSTRDYNGMAANLANRAAPPTGKSLTAFERAYVGRIASFDTFKMDYAVRVAIAGGGAGITFTTLAAGVNTFVPQATNVAATGERSNVDNRFQRVTVSTTAAVVAGDSFTIATVESVHHITKQPTGQLKTFRVISVDSNTTMTICPPLISGLGGTDPELQYKNCFVGTPVANSLLVFLNTRVSAMNPFWCKEAIEILPGRYAVPSDAGAGIMRATTDQGIELVMQKQYDINTMRTKYRLDTLFGVVNKQPEMSGIIMF
jgi:hypothetical protein